MNQTSTKPRDETADPRIRFHAHGVTGAQSLEVEFARSTPVDAVAQSLADMMNFPKDVPWGLRDDGSSVYLEDRPIGEVLAPDAHVSLTPKTHLGGA